MEVKSIMIFDIECKALSELGIFKDILKEIFFFSCSTNYSLKICHNPKRVLNFFNEEIF